MEPLSFASGLFIYGLYRAIEKVWEKGFDAAWAPLDEPLRERFRRLAGTDRESERREAFAQAAEIARANTLQKAEDPHTAERVLDALNSDRDPEGAEVLGEEAAKLMLFSARPDIQRLTDLCRINLHWGAVWGADPPPDEEVIATVLATYLANLHEALMDQPPYNKLIDRETLRAVREVVKELRPVEYDGEAAYRTQLAEFHRHLDFVGIPELRERRPIAIEHVFIPLRTKVERFGATLSVLSPRESRILRLRDGLAYGRRLSLEEVAARFGLSTNQIRAIEREARSKLPTPSASMQAYEAVQQTHRLVILGDPGTGKTTFLKYLTVICAEYRAEEELGLTIDGGSPLPVFVPLREFAAECADRDQDYCLLDYLYTYAREHLLINVRRDYFEGALKAGQCLVCLDGLDEVWALEQRKRVTDAVKALRSRFPGNRYIVTSRIVGYEAAPLDRRDFIHHKVLPLEDDDIRMFVRNWYAARERDLARRERMINDLIEAIEGEERIHALGRNPLLLTIIALIHRVEVELPQQRVLLYDKCVTTLVDTWEKVKGLTIAEKRRPFYRYRRRLLEQLAFELHASAEEPGRLQMVKQGDLEMLLTSFLMENRRLGLRDDPDAARDEAEAFIRLVRGRTGLLVEKGKGTFSFPHLTFQEYLAACDIEKRCIHGGADAIWDEIKDHVMEPHRQIVILLLLGSLNQYEMLSSLLVERILDAGQEDRFEPVLHRHLHLAARALADRVDISDDLHRRVVDDLVKIASEAPGWERSDALDALSLLEGDRYASAVLVALARDGQTDSSVRLSTASTLGDLGLVEEAGEILLDLAEDEQVESSVRQSAASALGDLGLVEEAGRILLELARDEDVDSSVRSFAARVMSGLERAAKPVLNGLLALARDESADSSVREDAVFALTELASSHTGLMSDLLELAQDQQMEPSLRCSAASDLGDLGWVEDAEIVLLELARDEQVEASVRNHAAHTLSRLGQPDAAVKTLLELALDGHVESSVRESAASWLVRMGRVEAAQGVLLELAQDGQMESSVRSNAVSALRQLGPVAEVQRTLLKLARNEQEDSSIRYAAASTLRLLGLGDKVEETLLELARDEQVESSVRAEAASTLVRMGRLEETSEILLKLARDKEVEGLARYRAYHGLKQLAEGLPS